MGPIEVAVNLFVFVGVVLFAFWLWEKYLLEQEAIRKGMEKEERH